jgi:DNA replication and repair protein RecF
LPNTGRVSSEGQFEREGKRERIVAKVIPRKKKELERNDVPYQRLSEHVGLLPVVMIAPDDTYLVSDGSEARRSFLDNTLSQIDNAYLHQLIAYNKLLKQRNALLKQFGEQGRYDRAMVEVYDQQMLAPAQAIHEARTAFMQGFQPLVQQAYAQISGEAESIDCTYRSKLTDTPFATLLAEAAEKDRILQRTTVGIHKDDLVFEISGYPLKRFASQGQLKSFVLSLKLAQYQVLREEKKVPPLLLLDDIFDKLDGQRVTQLLQLLQQQAFGQAFITDTDETRLSAIIRETGQPFLKYRITQGQAEKID